MRRTFRTIVAMLWAILVYGASDFKVLYQSPASTQVNPQCTLVEVSPGVLVGTTVFEGTVETQVFRITASGKFTVAATLDHNTQGAGAKGALVKGSDNYIYGSTPGYGPNGVGTVFRAGGKGGITILNDQLGYSSPLIEGDDGNLYGTAFQPGSSSSYGLFELSRAGQLVNFVSFPGAFSPTTVVQAGPPLEASDGNLYGEWYGEGGGTIYRVTRQGVYTTLHQSKALFIGGLTEGPDGRLYGASEGTVFAISKDGQFRNVHVFGKYDGLPQAGLTLASDGNFYGSTSSSLEVAPDGRAFLFRVAPDGSGYTVVHSFGQGYAGVYTLGPSLTQASNGKLYGTEIDPTGSQIYRLDLGLPQPLPAPRSFRPRSGSAGTHVMIAGTQMLAATGVSFNGMASPQYTNRGGNYIEAVVPPGASSGPITVTTANGQGSTKAKFTVE